MARTTKSQWDFGNSELFPAAALKPVWSVTDLTARVKQVVEKEFATVHVRGEVSNLRQQTSGHMYFVLKDAGAQLNCVLFRGQGGPTRTAIRDGAQVILGGELTVYEPRGSYQLRVTSVEAEGLGALQAAFERLKAKLSAEGLFASERKRPLPDYPRRIGIVTSPTGAALQDVLHVLGRRFAGLEIVLAPSRVQGTGAATEIVEAINRLNRWSAHHTPLDLILLTRGGGSLEDLWCFNEESVARAIATSALPIISAVGHEIDFTIADFVADLRAATPSAAAELITHNHVASREFVAGATARLAQRAHSLLAWAQDDLAETRRRLLRAHPRRRLESWAQQLDDWLQELSRAVHRALRDRRARLDSAQRALLMWKPRSQLVERQRRLTDSRRRLPELLHTRIAQQQASLGELLSRLRLLNPENVLQRGYSITLEATTGSVVRDPQKIHAGQRLRTRLATGEIHSVATRATSVNAPDAQP